VGIKGMKKQTFLRKTVATLLALIMVFSTISVMASDILVSPTDFDNTSLPFVDIGPMDWFYEQVRYVYEHGLMTGTNATTFNPNTPVTRAMAVQVLYNHGREQLSVGTLNNPFTDVAGDAWYHDAVVWAANNGIVNGLGDGIFAPSDYITRAHLVVVLNNYANIMELELPAQRNNLFFADNADIRNYAREAIQRFFMAMIISGRPDGTFDPQGNVTRAELASMLSSFVKYSENIYHSEVEDEEDDEWWLVQPPYGFPPYGFPI